METWWSKLVDISDDVDSYAVGGRSCTSISHCVVFLWDKMLFSVCGVGTNDNTFQTRRTVADLH